MDNESAVNNEAGTRGRMLVADDDPAILRLVATILEKENFTVVMARAVRSLSEVVSGVTKGTSRRTRPGWPAAVHRGSRS